MENGPVQWGCVYRSGPVQGGVQVRACTGGVYRSGHVQGGVQVSKMAENVEKCKNYEILAGLDGSDRIFWHFYRILQLFWYVSSKFWVKINGKSMIFNENQWKINENQ